MNKKKLLVTGGCGFIGRNLVNGFVSAGFDVIVLDFAGEAFRDDVTFINTDIRDKNAVIAACKGINTVIHNASVVHTKANHSKAVWEVNFQGTLNIIEACKIHKVPKLIYISSASVVYQGKDIENGNEKLSYSTISQAAYADSKIQAEKAVLAFNGSLDTTCCAIRPHVVFGPEDNRFIPAIIEKTKAGKLKRSIGKNNKLSDFTYVSNLVDAVIAAEAKLGVNTPVAGQAYFITNGEPISFFDFIGDFLMAWGQPAITKKVPFWLAYSVAAVLEFWDTLKGGTFKENKLTRFAVKYMVTHHYFSIDKAMKDLDWRPKVSLDEGIKLTIDDLTRKSQL